MLIVSAGMEKSGTGWYFNLTNDVLVAAGHSDSRQIREQYGLHSIMEHFNCNIGKLTASKLLGFKAPLQDGKTFCVKTHGGYTSDLADFMQDEQVKATYIYRDPRDVVLSLLDHGQKARDKSEAHVFGTIRTIQDAVDWVNTKLIPIWEQWASADGVLMVRYEDLFDFTLEEMKRLCDFLDIKLSDQELLVIASEYAPVNHKTFWKKGLHFNKGQKSRFVSEMKKTEIELCNRHFSPYFGRMNYSE